MNVIQSPLRTYMDIPGTLHGIQTGVNWRKGRRHQVHRVQRLQQMSHHNVNLFKNIPQTAPKNNKRASFWLAWPSALSYSLLISCLDTKSSSISRRQFRAGLKTHLFTQADGQIWELLLKSVLFYIFTLHLHENKKAQNSFHTNNTFQHHALLHFPAWWCTKL